MRLLVNAPSEVQELIHIGPGGGYFDESRVLWDERKDGPLPDITVGGMVKNKGRLEFSQQLYSAFIEKTAPKERPKSEVEMLKETLIAKGILTEADASIEVKK